MPHLHWNISWTLCKLFSGQFSLFCFSIRSFSKIELQINSPMRETVEWLEKFLCLLNVVAVASMTDCASSPLMLLHKRIQLSLLLRRESSVEFSYSETHLNSVKHCKLYFRKHNMLSETLVFSFVLMLF